MAASRRVFRHLISAISVVILLFLLVACPTEETSQPAPRANVNIGALRMGATTVFRVTVNSVQDLSGATSFNLIGDDTEPAGQVRQNFGNQAENFVFNRSTINLEIYNAAGNVLAETELDANDYRTGFTGTITLRRVNAQAARSVPPAVTFEFQPVLAATPAALDRKSVV